MKKNLVISILIIIAVVAVGFLLLNRTSVNFHSSSTQGIKRVKIGEKTINVDLALTSEEQATGLSGRNNLPEDKGMLFVFPKPDKYYFWMKGMNFPIDIIWLNADKKIIYIKKNALPESYLETYGPDVEAEYVLEVVSGFVDKNNLKVGDKAVFLY